MNGNIEIKINMDKETIKLYINRLKVGEIEFLIDEYQINLSYINILPKYKLNGYGCLMINALKGIAQFYKKSIYVISYENKINFYEKMEFHSLNKGQITFKNNINIPQLIINNYKINIFNLNFDRPLNNQISKTDMIWIPNSLNEVSLYL